MTRAPDTTLPGPIAARYYESRKRVIAIMGPWGSGKTGTTFLKAAYFATLMRPSPRDGIRRFKITTIRDTYRNLWSTTIPSWWKRYPKSLKGFTGSEGEPARHAIAFEHPVDGGRIEFVAEFYAIGDNAVDEFMAGKETTVFYLNEVDKLSLQVFNSARGRAGRFPDMADCGPEGPAYYGVWSDLNAPEVDSPHYDLLFKAVPPEWDVFVQPGGLDPGAENLANLPPGYYQDLIAKQPDWWVRRYIRNQFVPDRSGKAVYEEFNDQRHVAAAALAPIANAKLIIGLDGGATLRPAAVLVQRNSLGQWRALDEIVTEHGTGAARFADLLNRLLTERYGAWRLPRLGGGEDWIECWADPNSFYGADQKGGERTWAQIVMEKCRLRLRPAPSNNLLPRLDAVRGPLVRTIDGTNPGLMVSPRCAILRRGFNGSYKYRKLQVPGDARYAPEPEKNEFSDPHDALQYALLGGGEYAAVMGRDQRGARRSLQALTIVDPR